MRLGLGITGLSVYALLATAILAGGCGSTADCEKTLTCGGIIPPPDPQCVPSTATGAIPATCGIFVSTSGEVNSISKALELLSVTPRTPDSNPASIYVYRSSVPFGVRGQQQQQVHIQF